MKIDKFIFDTFLRLTARTCPHGLEADVMNDSIKNIIPDIKLNSDRHGNYFYKIGESKTVFTSHIDTVSKNYEIIKHVFEGDMIKTDGNTILGADDKAGMTVMFWMMLNNVPGLYYFFVGEEVGCIGSGLVAKLDKLEKNYDRVISFDRRGTSSVITFQSYTRCCSDAFADQLCSELNKSGLSYKKDDGGTHTDSAEFTDDIPECTNISVGYYKEHTNTEYQDMKHLIALANACVSVDWENLITKRVPGTYDFKSYSTYTTPRTTNVNYPEKSYALNNTWEDEWNEDAWDRNWDAINTHNQRVRDKRLRNDGLVEIDNATEYYLQKWEREHEANYDWIINKYKEDKISEKELQKLKECYFDMDSSIDLYFYNELKAQLELL